LLAHAILYLHHLLAYAILYRYQLTACAPANASRTTPTQYRCCNHTTSRLVGCGSQQHARYQHLQTCCCQACLCQTHITSSRTVLCTLRTSNAVTPADFKVSAAAAAAAAEKDLLSRLRCSFWIQGRRPAVQHLVKCLSQTAAAGAAARQHSQYISCRALTPLAEHTAAAATDCLSAGGVPGPCWSTRRLVSAVRFSLKLRPVQRLCAQCNNSTKQQAPTTLILVSEYCARSLACSHCCHSCLVQRAPV
jgi:hypothetical protein